MKIIEDRYNGITIDISTISSDVEIFQKEIKELLFNQHGKNLLWITIDIQKSHYIPILTKLGFIFHHCNENNITLVKKLIKNPIIPTAKNHTLGVGAMAIKENEILVIKNKFSRGYMLPGGHIDNNESISSALVREVFEETGVQVEFESVINISHFTQGQFGESNMYIISTVKVIDDTITIYDTQEILDAKWIDVDMYLNDEYTNDYNKNIVTAYINNKTQKLSKDEIKLNIQSQYEVFI